MTVRACASNCRATQLRVVSNDITRLTDLSFDANIIVNQANIFLNNEFSESVIREELNAFFCPYVERRAST